MTKKKKAFMIIAAMLAIVVLAVSSINIAFAVVGNQQQNGVAKGYDFATTNTFDISKITSLNAADKDFKILCLTDIHLKNSGTAAAFLGVNYILDWASEIALNKLIKNSDANLIVVLGDTTLTRRNDIEYARFVKFMDKFRIPWAIVFGNHDEEGRADIAKLSDVLLGSEYGLYEFGAADLHGAGNYVININRGENIVYSLYMMYTGMCTIQGADGKMHEDGINQKQIDWYNWNRQGVNSAAGAEVANMSFFHIPLPQYKDLDTFTQGNREEPSFVQYLDYGFFNKFKAGGGTHIFAGHDHNNNFVAEYQGVKLCYAQKSSYNCYFKGGMTGGTLVTIKTDNSVTTKLVNF